MCEWKIKIGDSLPVLKDMTTESRTKLLSHAQLFDKEASSNNILTPGTSCGAIFFFLSGSARVFQLSEEGKEITLYRLQEGEVCTLTATTILGDKTFPAYTHIFEDATILSIDQRDFKEVFDKDDTWRQFILESMSTKMVDLMVLVESVVFRKVEYRLIQVLKNNEFNGEVLMTHEALALELGTAREVVSRVLKDLEKDGLVKLSRNKIVIGDVN